MNCDVVDEMEVAEPYKGKIEAMIREYTPKKDVKTAVETKIILKDEVPVNLRPRRLAL